MKFIPVACCGDFIKKLWAVDISLGVTHRVERSAAPYQGEICSLLDNY
jgi:hypothetical protein